MLYTIQNKNLQLTISSKWAEIVSLLYNNKEYIYQKMDNFWQRQSPVLFPIVWALKENSYTYNTTEYILSQHGFARDMEFNLQNKDNNSIEFSLEYTHETMEKYPFKFILRIIYIINNDSINVQYIVENRDNCIMPYNIWGHPAWKIDGNIENYSLKFVWEQSENILITYPLDHWILRSTTKEYILIDWVLPLYEWLFSDDALICKNIHYKSIELYKGSKKLLSLSSQNMPHLWIWKQNLSPFLCIEPWNWFADTEINSWEIFTKEGIHILGPWEQETSSWSVQFFK